ncbi:IN2-2 protein [Pyrus ussuriensis x Pyrus communis]|uniref:IN2-2 protein n=1 Tax=Pyrus ussuriensis x Pyrus communis TaxID=2448454 RepID=A0A5N5HAA3_9ROSA|nr:IN2-2 protein [Pyrus ussuriensis x Pyrus communis]
MTGVVRRIKWGSQGLEFSAQGLGCMGMSAFYSAPKPDQDMITLIHHAIDAGVTFLDTSDVYGPFTNETLLGKVEFTGPRTWYLGLFWINAESSDEEQALKGGVRDKVELATKFGDPAYVRASLESSLKRLGVDSVDLYDQHRIDTSIPVEVTLALAWVHHQGNDVCPIPGTTKIANFDENIAALTVKLTPEELAEIESYGLEDAVKGDRMPSHGTWRNSETPPLPSL